MLRPATPARVPTRPLWFVGGAVRVGPVGTQGEAVTYLRAADWDVLPIPEHSTAVRLIETWHYAHSAPNTSTYRHGIYRKGEPWGDPYGVALWIPPTRAAAETVAGDWRGVLALSRLVVDPDLPTNGASFLLGRSMRQIDRTRWHTFITYADTAQGHTGAIYKATNWTELGPVPAGDTWVDDHGRQRGRKRGGRTLTAAEMRALGFVRQPSLPKIKFVQWEAA